MEEMLDDDDSEENKLPYDWTATT